MSGSRWLAAALVLGMFRAVCIADANEGSRVVLMSPDRAVRLAEASRIVADDKQFIARLVDIVRKRQGAGLHDGPMSRAALMLGYMHAKEAASVLIENVSYCSPGYAPFGGTETIYAYPCLVGLRRMGKDAGDACLDMIARGHAEEDWLADVVASAYLPIARDVVRLRGQQAATPAQRERLARVLHELTR